MFDNDREVVDYSTPSYDLFSSDLFVALVVATGLTALNIALIFGAGFTAVADIVPALLSLPFGNFILMIVFGVLLTGSRYAGISGVQNGNLGMSVAGVVGSQTVFTVFGAGILGMFSSDIWVPALAITGGITAGITAVASAIVFGSNHSFENWAKYSGMLFLVGIGAFVIAEISALFALIAIGFFILGFIADLFYELWSVTGRDLSPLANGIGVYVAVMGIFVHILQFVLQALAEE